MLNLKWQGHRRLTVRSTGLSLSFQSSERQQSQHNSNKLWNKQNSVKNKLHDPKKKNGKVIKNEILLYSMLWGYFEPLKQWPKIWQKMLKKSTLNKLVTLLYVVKYI